MAFGFGALPGFVDDYGRRLVPPAQKLAPTIAPFGFVPGAEQVPAAPQGSGAGPLGFGRLPAPEVEAPAPSVPRAFAPGSDAARMPTSAPTRSPAQLAPAGADAAVPLPPERPAEFGARAAEPTAPAPGPATPPSAAKASPDFLTAWKSLADTGIGDQALAFAGGLLSAPGARGLGAGFTNLSRASAQTAATDLARAKQAVEQQKLARETQGITANAGLMQKAYPGITPEQATALAANPSLLQEALKIIRDGNHGRENDPAVIRMKAQAQAEGTAAGKPDETFSLVPEEERAALGLPAGSYQKDSKGKISPVNPTGTTINMGAEKAQDATVGKGYGDYQLDLATKGRNAASTLNTLALMEQAMRTPGFYSGVGGEGVKRANQFLAALGVKDAKAASGAEVFDALSNKVVLDGLGGSLGPGISNTDRDYIARTAPTLAQSEQGNRDLIGIARMLAQRQQAVSKLAREYAGKNGGRLDAGFDQALDEYAAQNPLFPQAREAATASAPQEPPQGAPQGARQAPDGLWYAPDPRRPGKFVRVVQ